MRAGGDMSATPARVEPAPLEVGEEVLRYLGLDPRNIETHALVLLCERYRLDPLLGHASVIVTKNGPRPYITRDGMLEVAHRSGQLDGITVDEERRSSDGHGFTAYVSVWRKDCAHPFRYGAQCKDDEAQAKQGNGPEMALARAERRALRRAFSIPAYDEIADHQIDIIEADSGAELASAGAAPEEPAPAPLTDETREEISALFIELRMLEPKAQLAYASSVVGRELAAPGHLTEDEGARLVTALRATRELDRRVR
jgi:hypothetical protein